MTIIGPTRILHRGEIPSDNLNNQPTGSLYYATHDKLLSISELQSQLALELLPVGKRVTPNGHETYFNEHHAVLFACDSVKGVALPVTRFAALPDESQGLTVLFDTDATDDLTAMQIRLRAYLNFYEMYSKSGTYWFNGLTPHRRESVLLHLIAVYNVPYGRYVTDSCDEYYFNRDYFVLFGWNPRERVLLPTTHDMIVASVRTEYVYKSWTVTDQSFKRSLLLMDGVYLDALIK